MPLGGLYLTLEGRGFITLLLLLLLLLEAEELNSRLKLGHTHRTHTRMVTGAGQDMKYWNRYTHWTPLAHHTEAIEEVKQHLSIQRTPKKVFCKSLQGDVNKGHLNIAENTQSTI